MAVNKIAIDKLEAQREKTGAYFPKRDSVNSEKGVRARGAVVRIREKMKAQDLDLNQ